MWVVRNVGELLLLAIVPGHSPQLRVGALPDVLVVGWLLQALVASAILDERAKLRLLSLGVAKGVNITHFFLARCERNHHDGG